MKFFLNSPFHFVVSKYILLITFTGRKSGKTYTTPTSYLREDNMVILFTHAKWWKNLVGGAPVSLCIRGQILQGTAEPITEDKETMSDALYRTLAHNPRDAKYYNVTCDENGLPNRDECLRAVQDAVMIQVQLN